MVLESIETAKKIESNTNELEKLGFIVDCNWTCKKNVDREKFLELVKREKILYRKLRRYKDNLFIGWLTKKISKEDYDKVSITLKSFTYK